MHTHSHKTLFKQIYSNFVQANIVRCVFRFVNMIWRATPTYPPQSTASTVGNDEMLLNQFYFIRKHTQRLFSSIHTPLANGTVRVNSSWLSHPRVLLFTHRITDSNGKQ